MRLAGATTACLWVACAPATPSPATRAVDPVEPAWRARGAGGIEPIDVGTTAAELVDAATCQPCHAAITDEWAASRHALAWTNGIFQREYQAAPKAWCVNCHAPMPVQQEELAAGNHRIADQGINCATCHVRRGRLVAASRSGRSPHDTVVDPGFGSPAFCADCHQFPFPILEHPSGTARATTRYPMQDTVASFLRGPYATERDGCLTCHGSASNHRFPGGHDPDMLAGALEVTWCRTGTRIAVTLANVGAGHAVPTGDIHRHMNLRVWRSSAPERMYEGFVGRRFSPAADGGKHTTWDSSILPSKSQRHVIEVDQLGDPDDGTEPINLALNYVYVADEFPRSDRAPTEPVTAPILSLRVLVDEIPSCDSPR